MKKVKWLFTVLFLLLTASVIYAEVGIKGGVNLAKMSSSIREPDEDHKNLLGYRVGGFYCFNLSSRLALQPEIHYVRKGTKLPFKEGDFDGYINTRMEYLEIPLLLKVNLSINGKITPHLLLGGYVAYNLNSKIFTSPETSEGTKELDGFFTRLDWGLAIGLGVAVPAGKKVVIIEARYSHGMADINDIFDDNDVIKNKSFTFMIGIGF